MWRPIDWDGAEWVYKKERWKEGRNSVQLTGPVLHCTFKWSCCWVLSLFFFECQLPYPYPRTSETVMKIDLILLLQDHTTAHRSASRSIDRERRSMRCRVDGGRTNVVNMSYVGWRCRFTHHPGGWWPVPQAVSDLLLVRFVRGDQSYSWKMLISTPNNFHLDYSVRFRSLPTW